MNIYVFSLEEGLSLLVIQTAEAVFQPHSLVNPFLSLIQAPAAFWNLFQLPDKNSTT